MTPVETVLAFFDAINQHDPGKLAELMTGDHVFIDSLGNSLRGREKMSAGWQAYFTMCPDYQVSREDVLHAAGTVAVFGFAGGTISANGELLPANKWRPAAWQPHPANHPPPPRGTVSKSLQRNYWHRKAALPEPPVRAPSAPFG